MDFAGLLADLPGQSARQILRDNAAELLKLS
jgi:hypothetical protein